MKRTLKRKLRNDNDDRAIAAFYDKQNEQEVLDEIEAAMNDPQSVMIPVPRSLLSDVLKFLDKKKKSA